MSASLHDNPDTGPSLAEAFNEIDAWQSDVGCTDPTCNACRGLQRIKALLTHLAALLDGVLADDPGAIRDAAAWLAANRPEVDG